MPTDETWTVSPGGGGDYTTLEAAVTAKVTGRNLVTADVTVTIQVDDQTTETLNVTLNATTDATRYVVIKAAAGAENKGVQGQGGGCSWSSLTGGGACLDIDMNYLTIQDLHFTFPSMSFRQMMDISSSGGNDNLVIERCMFYDIGTTASSYDWQDNGITINGGDHEIIIRNCIFDSITSSGIQVTSQTTADSIEIYHCSLYDCERDYNDADTGGIGSYQNSNSPILVIGCISCNSGARDFHGSQMSTSCRDNVSSDTSSPGTNNTDNAVVTDEWTAPATSDFTVKSGATIRNYVATTIVTKDVTGADRGAASHDCGAFDEDAGAGGVALPLFVHHYAQQGAR